VQSKSRRYNFDGNKLIYHMDRVYAHYLRGEKIYPLHIDLGATKACNARCRYCYGVFQKMTGEMIRVDVLKKLLRDAPLLGIKSMTITGDGEPTINPGIYDAVQTGKQYGLDIGFATNGIALNPNKIMTLLESLVWMRFNLSAADREAYKFIHGIDAWDKVQENIVEAVELKRILNENCTIGLQMVLTPETFDNVLKEAEFAIETEVDYFVIKQYSDPGCSTMSPFDMKQYDEMTDTLKKAEAMSNDKTKIIPKYSHIAMKGKRNYDHCVDCPLLFQISGSGKCYPCGYLFGNDRFCYGDLHKQSLKEILDSEHYWEIIKYMREKFDVHKDCEGCCRHDSCNEFIWDFIHIPEHLNFI